MNNALWLLTLYLVCASSVHHPHLHLHWLSKLSKDRCFERGKKLLIFPGTKWCGYGNRAKDYNDLGRFAMTDACCRDHDHCPDRIHGKETKYGLTNKGRFTRYI